MSEVESTRRLLAAFDEFIELDETARSVRMKELEGSDPSLVALLRRMLEADACPDRVTRGIHAPQEDNDLPEPVSGDRRGSWRLLRVLGSGGMGSVWLAERASGEFEQLAALKVMRIASRNPVVLRRFERERSILARLEHPNIARLLDGGVSFDGRPWFAMEYVDGGPLLDYADRQSLDIQRRLGMFSQVLDAVAYAHRRLVVHRDLKPSNVMVDDADRVRLIDFGIAKLLDDSAGEDTLAGTQPMTPAYAAPEQRRGEPVTTSTDVYSLGLLFFELLTGIRPDPEVRRLAPSQAVERSGDVGLLAARRATTSVRFAAQLRGDLDAIVRRALVEDPADRYASVEAFAEDLARSRGNRPVRARGASVAYRLGKFLRRQWLPCSALSLLVLTLVVSAIDSGMARKRTEAALHRADAVRGFLIDLFALNEPENQRGVALEARQIVDLGARRAETALREDPDTRIELLGVVGNLYKSLGEYARSGEVLNRRLEEAQRRYAPGDPRLIDARLDQAGAELRAEQFDRSRSTIESVLAALPSKGGDPRQRARALGELAAIENATSHYAKAVEVIRPAVSLLRQSGPSEWRPLAEALTDLGHYIFNSGDFAGAESPLREAVALMQGHGDEVPGMMIAARFQLASVLSDLARFDEALLLLDENAALAERIYGPGHAVLADQVYQIAQVQRLSGDLEHAIPHYRKALAIYEKAFGAEHSYVATSLASLGQALGASGRHAEAVDTLQRALGIYVATLGPNHLFSAIGTTALAQARLDGGDAKGAETGFRDALGRFGAGGNGDHIYAEAARRGLGEALAIEHRQAEAEPLLRVAYQRLSHAFGAGDYRSADTAVSLAKCLVALGKRQEAMAILDETRHAIPAQSSAGAKILDKVESARQELAKANANPASR